MAKLLTHGATYVERGYGQVEPNHLSAQRTGQIYAQLPAEATIDVLQNGQFAKYDYANNVVNFTGAGEWMLVFNEIKLYDEREMDCDFALVRDEYEARIYDAKGTKMPVTKAIPNDLRTKMVPRLFKTNVGDIFTTNTIKATTLAVGDTLQPDTDGLLKPATATEEAPLEGMVWQVVKVYTMPDNQKGVKIMRIQ